MGADFRKIVAKNRWLERPIFAFGSGRCGSTLLRTLVDSHPQLLTWPFELPYYRLFKRAVKNKYEHVKVKDLMMYLKKHESVFGGIGKTYDGDLGEIKYNTNTIDLRVFYKTLENYWCEKVSRKEFLQLIIYAYQKSIKIKEKPMFWFATLTVPTSDPLIDFPRCKAVILTRNPIDTYVSVKQFYFRGAELQGRDKCSVYRPKAAAKRCNWGLLQTAVSPIMNTYMWLEENRKNKNVLQIKLEDLRDRPEENMRIFADFCGIEFHPILLEPTFLGNKHHSNLSSGKSSEGKIVSVEERESYLDDLTEYEFYWVCRLFERISKNAGYHLPKGIPTLRGFRRIFAFIKQLKNEFPKRGKDMAWKEQRLNRVAVRLGRWVFAPIGFLVNRYIMLSYGGYKKLLVRKR